MRVVKAFAAEPRQLERFRANVARVFTQSMYATRLRAFYNPFLAFLPNLGLAIILLVGGRQVMNGTLTLGDFTAFYTYLLMMIGPMRMLGVALGLAQRATASGARLLEILDRDPRIVSGGAALPAGQGRVELRDVSFGYGEGPNTLHDVSLTVEPGSTVALVGATGSGKTTLTQLLSRLYDVRSGAVLVDGADVRDLDLVQLRRAIAVVDDDPFLFSDTVAGNIAYARPDAPHGGDQAGGGARAGRGLHRRAAGGLRHARRRARPDAVRRAAPADRDRAGAAGRSADPRPRRRDLVGRRDDRARDQGRAARGDGGPHDVRDRPPALDDRPGRRHRRARARAASSRAAITRRCCASPRCTRRSPPRACRTRSSSTAIRSSGWRACERDAPQRPGPALAGDVGPRAQAARARSSCCRPTAAAWR